MIHNSRRCPECDKDNCVYCNDCNRKHWEENFNNWSSGDFYKAIWKDGPIENYEPWDTKEKKWRRKTNTKVAIKKLKVAEGITSLELSNEIKCNLEHNSLFISRVYGVTKDPSTQEYAIVMQFQEYGDIRKLMRENHEQLSEYPKYNLNLLKSDFEREFSTSKEIEWKKQLAKLVEGSLPPKETRQLYTSKPFNFSKILSNMDSNQNDLILPDDC
ncbi:21494_t:CDS:2 [Gigaspora rosea]|nr:21494_t:CDS:2 [Gigaspora rosea]